MRGRIELQCCTLRTSLNFSILYPKCASYILPSFTFCCKYISINYPKTLKQKVSDSFGDIIYVTGKDQVWFILCQLDIELYLCKMLKSFDVIAGHW